MIPTASSSRSRRSPKPLPKSIPNASCSRSNQPPPRPSTDRPPLIWSTVVASFAVRPGFRNVLAATSSPILARVVTAATAASVAQPSSLPSSGSPSSDSRWSSTQRLSAPACLRGDDRVA